MRLVDTTSPRRFRAVTTKKSATQTTDGAPIARCATQFTTKRLYFAGQAEVIALAWDVHPAIMSQGSEAAARQSNHAFAADWQPADSDDTPVQKLLLHEASSVNPRSRPPSPAEHVAAFAHQALQALAASPPLDLLSLLQPAPSKVSRAAAKQICRLFTLSSSGAVAPRHACRAHENKPRESSPCRHIKQPGPNDGREDRPRWGQRQRGRRRQASEAGMGATAPHLPEARESRENSPS